MTDRVSRPPHSAAPDVELEFVYEPDDAALEEAIAILLGDGALPVDRPSEAA